MLTKDIIGTLSVEQRELLAQMEFRRTQQRLKLLELARGQDWRSRYSSLYVFAVALLFVGLYCFDCSHVQENPGVIFLPLGVTFVFSLFSYLTRTNRRLDALLELLAFDREHPEINRHAKDGKAG